MREFGEEKFNEDESVKTDKYSSEINACEMEFDILNKKIKRLEITSIISLFLLIAILGMGFVNKPKTNLESIEVASQKELPSILNKAKIEAIGKEVVEAYNSSDIDSMYSTLGSYAQTIVTKEKLEEDMKGLSILGNIGKYSYTHYEFMGNDDGADWYSLNYIANYSAGNGTLKINLRIADNTLEIVGFFMNVEKLDFEKLEK